MSSSLTVLPEPILRSLPLDETLFASFVANRDDYLAHHLTKTVEEEINNILN